MSSPQRGSNTSTQLIEVNWQTITSPQNGLAEVTSYSLEWDAGSAGETWVPEIGYLSNSLDLTYSVSDNIVPGNEY